MQIEGRWKEGKGSSNKALGMGEWKHGSSSRAAEQVVRVREADLSRKKQRDWRQHRIQLASQPMAKLQCSIGLLEGQ